MGTDGSAAGSDAAPSRRALRTTDFDYPLPERLVAQRPPPRRGESRMLVVNRNTGALDDRAFSVFADLPAAGDALVLNDSRVFPARLLGRKPTGAGAEILLLRPIDDAPIDRELPGSPHREGARARRWEALVRPGGKLKPGRRVVVAAGFEVEIEDSTPSGGRIVRLVGDGDPWELIERHGRTPLPPYIAREDDDEDRRRYQTVYAERTGSVAAPTAGLHFTEAALTRLEERGVKVVRVTLHVGVGTFRPVDAERPEEHELEAERYEVSAAAAGALNEVRSWGRDVWAVGTTAVRTLESVIDERGRFGAGRGWTDLFIHPPHRFRAVDRMLTNFHLPRSSLLMLVSAFAGHELTMKAYRHAIEAGYRFYSYGDAMLVL